MGEPGAFNYGTYGNHRGMFWNGPHNLQVLNGNAGYRVAGTALRLDVHRYSFVAIPPPSYYSDLELADRAIGTEVTLNLLVDLPDGLRGGAAAGYLLLSGALKDSVGAAYYTTAVDPWAVRAWVYKDFRLPLR